MDMPTTTMCEHLGICTATLAKIEKGEAWVEDDVYQKQLLMFWKWKNEHIQQMQKEIKQLKEILND